MKAFALSSFVSCGVFLIQILLHVPSVSADFLGRYNFISGSHPNLGGEILYAGFVAFCLSKRTDKEFMIVFGFYIVELYFLQSRAALISFLFVTSVYIYDRHISHHVLERRIFEMLSLIFVLGMLIYLHTRNMSGIFSLDDKYRGVGTGFVGREERWEFAWDTFKRNPIFGVGFGYFRNEEMADYTPHNMWLYMVTTMGAMCVITATSLFRSILNLYNVNRYCFLLVCSSFPMTIFNDRFLNLNPYPFLFFVILLLPTKIFQSRPSASNLQIQMQRSDLSPTRVSR
jgi:hypothetical protein